MTGHNEGENIRPHLGFAHVLARPGIDCGEHEREEILRGTIRLLDQPTTLGRNQLVDNPLEELRISGIVSGDFAGS